MSTTYIRLDKTIGIFFGTTLSALVILGIYSYGTPLLHYKRWVAIAVLSTLVLFLLYLIGAIKRFHESVVKELNSDFKTRAGNIYKLSLAAGYAEQIDRLHVERKEVPRKMYEDFKLQLLVALQSCYGKDGISIFYGNNSDKIAIPDDPYVWFSISHSRLSQIITVQIQERLTSHTAAIQKQ